LKKFIITLIFEVAISMFVGLLISTTSPSPFEYWFKYSCAFIIISIISWPISILYFRIKEIHKHLGLNDKGEKETENKEEKTVNE